MYNFPCENCGGKVVKNVVKREAFRHKGKFVILEQVPIGVCGKCGARYFDAKVLRCIAEVGRGTRPCARKEEVPVATYAC